MESLRVLTFNSHQPYLHLLASSLPWTFGIVTPQIQRGLQKRWDPRIRPLPANVTMYESLQDALKKNPWDWILAHNVDDLLDARDVGLPKVFLVHGTLSGRMLQDRSTINREQYLKNLGLLLRAYGARVVYISELKRNDWGMAGEVIRPAVNTEEYGGYRGEIRGILQVCNHLKGRGTMMGWETYEEVCRDLPNLVLGENPDLASSRMTIGWDDLKEQMRAYRVYLYTPIYPHEDGYNLGLLEAMATGMPVATLRSDTSPIRDGCEGFVCSTVTELREKVLFLLDNPELALAMGKAARDRVEQEFPVSAFAEAWEAFAHKLTGK
jgi:hypothetical protein